MRFERFMGGEKKRKWLFIFVKVRDGRLMLFFELLFSIFFVCIVSFNMILCVEFKDIVFFCKVLVFKLERIVLFEVVGWVM